MSSPGRKAQKRLERDSAEATARRLRRHGTLGTVYVFRAGEYLKIGWVVKDVARRMRQVQGSCPLRVELVGVIPERTALDESDLHVRFHRSRVHGEWFRQTEELADFISRELILPAMALAATGVPKKSGPPPSRLRAAVFSTRSEALRGAGPEER